MKTNLPIRTHSRHICATLSLWSLIQAVGTVTAFGTDLRVDSAYDSQTRTFTVIASHLDSSILSLEASADLQNWTPVASNAVPAWTVQFTQQNLNEPSSQFYRARAVPTTEQPYVPDEVLVWFRPGISLEQQDDVLRSLNLVRLEKIHTQPMQEDGLEPIIRVRTVDPVPALVAVLRTIPEVDHAEPVWLARFVAQPKDPDYTLDGQWGMWRNSADPQDPALPWNPFGSQAARVWEAGYTGSRGVSVGLIDTGIDTGHADLSGNIDVTSGWDFVHNDASVNDASSANPIAELHGTMVAGIIGALGDNVVYGPPRYSKERGIAGVNWRVNLIPLKVGENNTIANTGMQASISGVFPIVNAVKALDRITELKRKGVPIAAINASWGYYVTTLTDVDHVALREALIRAATSDILIVAAAGNDSKDLDGPERFFPAVADTTEAVVRSKGTIAQTGAGYNAIIGVAAIDKVGQLAIFNQSTKSTQSRTSNYGKKTIALLAPGSAILSTTPLAMPASQPPNGSPYGTDSGTSFAAPFVTGAIALYKSRYPNATAPQIRQVLLGSVKRINSLVDKTASGGCLDIYGMFFPPNSPLCPDVWVDLANTNPSPSGQQGNPFKTILAAHQAATYCTLTMRIKPGVYQQDPQNPLKLDKPLRLMPEGSGLVRLMK